MPSVLEKQPGAIDKMAAQVSAWGANARSIARKTVEAACSNSVPLKEDLPLVRSFR